MMISTKTCTLAVSLIASVLIASTGAAEQIDYPTNNVRLFVPAAPGGATDTVARAYAQAFEAHTGTPMAIVNQTGGGGVIAFQSMVTANPNGATLLFYHGAMHVAHGTGRSPFGQADMRTLATLGESNEVYALAADAPYDTLEEMIEYAESGEGRITVGMQLGGTTQVKAQALANQAESGIRAVDAGSESQRVTALLGGQIDVGILGVSNAVQYERSGDIKILSVINDEPDPFNPDWPTTRDQGMDLSLPLVFTLFGQKEMDDDLVALLDRINDQISEDGEFLARLERYGIAPHYLSSTAASEMVEEEEHIVQGLLP